MDFLTTNELAEYLKCSMMTLQAWRDKSIGPPYFRHGSIIRYLKSDVDEFVKKQTRLKNKE